MTWWVSTIGFGIALHFAAFLAIREAYEIRRDYWTRLDRHGIRWITWASVALSGACVLWWVGL